MTNNNDDPIEVKPDIIPDPEDLTPTESDLDIPESPIQPEQAISNDEGPIIPDNSTIEDTTPKQVEEKKEEAPNGLKALFKPPLYKNKFVLVSSALILLIIVVSIIGFTNNSKINEETKALITPTAFTSTTITESPTVSATETPFVLENEYSVFRNDYVTFKYPKSGQVSVETTDTFLTDNVYLVGVRRITLNAKNYELNILPSGGMGWGSYEYIPETPTRIKLNPEGGDPVNYTLDKSVKKYIFNNNLNAISLNLNGKDLFLMNYMSFDGQSIEESRNFYFESSGTTVWSDKEFKFFKGFDENGVEKQPQSWLDSYIIGVDFKSNTDVVYSQFVQDFNQMMSSYKFLK